MDNAGFSGGQNPALVRGVADEETVSELLAQISAPHFCAGLLLRDGVVVTAAPIIGYMRRWSRDQVRAWCRQRGWDIRVVKI